MSSAAADFTAVAMASLGATTVVGAACPQSARKSGRRYGNITPSQAEDTTTARGNRLGDSALLMAALWAWHLRLKNAGVVDAGWAASLAIIGGIDGVWGPGDPWRRGLIAAMVIVWGTRLATYLLRDRVLGKPEDPRYGAIRAELAHESPGQVLLLFSGTGALEHPALAARARRRVRSRTRSIAARAHWNCDLDRVARGRVDRRSPARTIQTRPGQPRTRVPSGTVALFAAPELLLRMARVGRLGHLPRWPRRGAGPPSRAPP